MSLEKIQKWIDLSAGSEIILYFLLDLTHKDEIDESFFKEVCNLIHKKYFTHIDHKRLIDQLISFDLININRNDSYSITRQGQKAIKNLQFLDIIEEYGEWESIIGDILPEPLFK